MADRQRSLEDRRTEVIVGNVADITLNPERTFSAIPLNVDNKPEGLTQTDNQWLYSRQGLSAIYQVLHPEGILAIWFATPDQVFAIRLEKCGFKVDWRTARARPGKGTRHTIFLA